MERMASSAAVENSKLCQVFEKKNCLFEIHGQSLHSLAAGGQNLALNCRSFPLALQFLVQQRRFMSSVEQVPVVQRTYSSCTSHPRSDPLKRTTKRGTRGKDRSKKINISAKPTRSSPCAANWRVWGPKNPTLSKLVVARRFGQLAQREKQRSTGRCFIHSNKKSSSEICVPLGANFVNQPFCKSVSRLLKDISLHN